MAVTIISVGKIKEDYIKKGIQDYADRISYYSKINIVEVPDENSDFDKNAAITAEGKKILDKIPNSAYVIVLDIGGIMLSSEEFAKKIQAIYTAGKSNICFIIGGSAGLGDNVKAKADLLFSFSRLTFPHQLFRMILLEQIYRAFKINSNETYHK